jgi:hypothetical protein
MNELSFGSRNGVCLSIGARWGAMEGGKGCSCTGYFDSKVRDFVLSGDLRY